jgi:hypothetical protein
MAHRFEKLDHPTNALSLKDGLELALLAGNNVDGHWKQYYAYLFALLAWLSSGISTIGHNEAIIVTIATTAFFTLNGIATIRAYVLLSLIIDETTHIAGRSALSSQRVQNFVAVKRNRMKLPLRIPIAALAHAVGAVSIIYLVWKVETA